MTEEQKKTDKPDPEALRRREREERDRAAGNPTSQAEHKPDDIAHEEMSAEEKLQERTDDLMRRMP